MFFWKKMWIDTTKKTFFFHVSLRLYIHVHFVLFFILWFLLPSCPICLVGRDGAVGMATRYWPDSPGTEMRWRWYFPHPCRPALVPSPGIMGPGSLSREQSGRGVVSTTHLYLGRGSRKIRTIPLLPVRAFLACCRLNLALLLPVCLIIPLLFFSFSCLLLLFLILITTIFLSRASLYLPPYSCPSSIVFPTLSIVFFLFFFFASMCNVLAVQTVAGARSVFYNVRTVSESLCVTLTRKWSRNTRMAIKYKRRLPHTTRRIFDVSSVQSRSSKLSREKKSV